MMKKSKVLYTILYFLLTFVFSYGLGILFKDKYLLGSTTLYLGCIETYFMTKGKWYEEFVGIFETIVSTVVCVFACMYGSAIFTVIIYIPLSIFGIVNWKKNEKDDEVKLNKMTWKKSVITISIIVLATAVLSILLSLIPTQKLAVLDAAGDILNICGILLIALRYKEGWIVWILCNFVDLATWITALVKDYSSNAIMMIIMSIAYIILNIWGFYSFIKMRKKQETVDVYSVTEAA